MDGPFRGRVILSNQTVSIQFENKKATGRDYPDFSSS